MRQSYMPAKRAEQVAWINTFCNTVIPVYGNYGLTMEQANTMADLRTALDAAWAVTEDPATRTKITIAQRDIALRAAIVGARGLVSVIQGLTSVTDPMRIAAGITVRKTHPTRRPVPTQKPILVPTLVDGRIVMLELRQDTERRGKPTDVVSATIFTHEGPTAPTDSSDWKFYALVTKTTATIEFPPSTEFSTGWITAFWTNARGEAGPAATPINVVLTPGGMLPREADQAVTLKAA